MNTVYKYHLALQVHKQPTVYKVTMQHTFTNHQTIQLLNFGTRIFNSVMGPYAHPLCMQTVPQSPYTEIVRAIVQLVAPATMETHMQAPNGM